ncbi:DUF5333 domain-containing protein [Marivivens donghaensis]|uniref:DUF5333 domain-containing protein n=1 Tax=Marivivens donghaensis TaxID=1699413 RepID=A0ABX0VXL0_9RHOB|nr:DUF5333 domain-containing protein [Marivivens donghaensis]NIY72544.1 DUF5333 domain-containing protein [Marivivens donghaensis]
MRRLILPTLLAATIATASGAQTPLKDVTEISEGLIAAGMAIEIADNCDNISVRLIRGYSYLNGLKSRARDLGYSADEIDAYVDDKVEKARLEDIARERLATKGAVSGNNATYCAVGQAEMAANTTVGSLIH